MRWLYNRLKSSHRGASGRVAALVIMLVAAPLLYAEEKELDLDALLGTVLDGTASDAQRQADRIERFRENKAQQQALLNELVEKQEALEELSTQRESDFEANEQKLAQMEERLDERLGTLKELFGVLQQVASDANAELSRSMTQIHYPDRGEFLKNFASRMEQTTDLPAISEVERLWYELQREMTSTGEVRRFEHPVVTSAGKEVEKEVTRLGAFNLVADGKYLQFVPETGRVVEYGRQPGGRHLDRLEQLGAADAGERAWASLDPTRGQLLSLLVQAPNLRERVQQGGMIGFIIICLGAAVVLTAVIRLVYLLVVQYRINRQMADPENPGRNPLGRVLAAYRQEKGQDINTLELKVGEAVLREVPRMNRGLSFIKITAAIAPLMGLLGTVTGMIITFQAITLFGAGDPKLMAGGISQALVTTVLGLTVAIPTLLLHNLVQTRADHINDILEQEGVAIVAGQAEKALVEDSDQSSAGAGGTVQERGS